MATIACPVPGCDRPRPGHANVCGACAGQLARNLGNIPMLARQLDITLARQTSSTGGSRSSETPMPYNQAASDAADNLRATLVSWVRIINQHHHTNYIWPRDTLTGIARWLTGRHTDLCSLHNADEAVDEIGFAVRTAERAIDRPADRWFAGKCDCDADLYVAPGSPTVTCRDCRHRYDVRERRAWLLEAAEDQLAYAALIAQALTTLGQPVTPERIRKWAERGRIIAHGNDPRGRPQYRVGDVRELLLADAHRKHEQRDKVAS